MSKTIKIGVVALIVVSAMVISGLYLRQNNHTDYLTVNEFYNDLIDKNNDGIIGTEDSPLNFTSHNVNDTIYVRDKISRIYYSHNYTVIDLGPYSGKYQIRHSYCWPVVENITRGDFTGTLRVGDHITFKTVIILHQEDGGETNSEWIIVQ
jgi:hypothetical protein